MSSSDGKDPWAELVRSAPQALVDPSTGEVVIEQLVTRPRKRKAVDAGYVMLNMDAMAVAARHLGGPGMVILMEAARQWRMGNGAVAVTAAFGTYHGLTERRRRSAITDLVKLEEATGWVKVSQYKHRAPRVEMTTAGMQRVWRAKAAASRPE